MSLTEQLKTRPKLWAAAGLVTVGLAAGGILGTTMTAGASTTSTSTGSTSTSTGSGSASSTPGPPGPGPGGTAGQYHGLSDSGTVTAVGTDSVTIDAKVYAVTSNSDIDKNGEAVLSDLKVGDKVTFNTVSSATTPTIDKLHAGSESLDRPTGPPNGGVNGAAPGMGSNSQAA